MTNQPTATEIALKTGKTIRDILDEKDKRIRELEAERDELERKYIIALHLAHSWGSYFSVESVEEEINRALDVKKALALLEDDDARS